MSSEGSTEPVSIKLEFDEANRAGEGQPNTQKRTRCRNFIPEEIHLLETLHNAYKDVLTDKKGSDFATLHAKGTAWKNLTREFNSKTLHGSRTPKQLQTCFKNIKKRRKVAGQEYDLMEDATNFSIQYSEDNNYLAQSSEETGDLKEELFQIELTETSLQISKTGVQLVLNPTEAIQIYQKLKEQFKKGEEKNVQLMDAQIARIQAETKKIHMEMEYQRLLYELQIQKLRMEIDEMRCLY